MQNQGLPRLQSKVDVSLGNLPRLCLKIIVGAKEIVRQLGALAALTEDLGSVPSTFVKVHNHL